MKKLSKILLRKFNLHCEILFKNSDRLPIMRQINGKRLLIYKRQNQKSKRYNKMIYDNIPKLLIDWRQHADQLIIFQSA